MQSATAPRPQRTESNVAAPVQARGYASAAKAAKAAPSLPSNAGHLEEALAAAMENVSIAADTGAGAGGEATGQDEGSGSGSGTAGTQMNGYVQRQRFSFTVLARSFSSPPYPLPM